MVVEYVIPLSYSAYYDFSFKGQESLHSITLVTVFSNTEPVTRFYLYFRVFQLGPGLVNRKELVSQMLNIQRVNLL